VPADRRTLRACSLSFVAYGVALSVLGPILPGIRRDLHAGDVATGAIVGLAGGAWGLGVLLSGPLQQRRGRRLSFRIGMTLVALGMIGVAAAPSTALVMMAVIGSNLGGGLLAGAINSTAADLGTDQLAVANGAFGVGAIIGPLTAATVIALGAGWRLAPVIAAALCLGALPLATAIPDVRPGRHADRHGLGGLLRAPLFGLLVATLALEIAAEAGLIGWFPTYAVDARGFPEWLGAASPMAFWTGVTAARFLLPQTGLAEHPRRVIYPMPLAAGIAVALVFVVPGPPLAIGLFLVVGFATGGVFPLVLGAAKEAYPHDVDATTAIMLGASGTTELFLPILLGGASALAGTTAAGLAVVAMAFLAATAAAVGLRRV
jgi:fucose permease